MRDSLQIDSILTRQVDSCNFTIRKYGAAHTFRPKVGQEVVVYDGLTKVFGGVIVRIADTMPEELIALYEVECNDYGRILDRPLVNASYTDKTIDYIINDIIVGKGLNAVFTQTNVDCPKTVSYVAFKYEPLSSVLTQLADLVNYDWYVDYDKDIHFFAKDATDAPVEVTDGTGRHIKGSLVIRQDNSQVRNVVYVRGGEYLGATFSATFVSDGKQNVYPLGYKYDDIKVSVTGSVWDGGVDGTDPIAAKDYLWNQEQSFIRFRGDRIPSSGSSFTASGQPYLPVLVKVRDQDSIDSMFSAEGIGNGEYEYLIVDKSIDSRAGARERAVAELTSYKETLSEGEFETYTSGFLPGQRIHVDLDSRDIDDYFVINRVTATMWTENELLYRVNMVTTKTMGVIDFLRKLLMGESKKITINENEAVDLVESFATEGFAITEATPTVSTSHNAQSETVTLGETVTERALDYDTEFVLGEMTPPTGTKRVFRLDGSPLL